MNFGYSFFKSDLYLEWSFEFKYNDVKWKSDSLYNLSELFVNSKYLSSKLVILLGLGDLWLIITLSIDLDYLSDAGLLYLFLILFMLLDCLDCYCPSSLTIFFVVSKSCKFSL